MKGEQYIGKPVKDKNPRIYLVCNSKYHSYTIFKYKMIFGKRHICNLYYCLSTPINRIKERLIDKGKMSYGKSL